MIRHTAKLLALPPWMIWIDDTHRYCPPDVGALNKSAQVKKSMESVVTNMLAISAMESMANEKPKSETRYIHTMPARPPLGRM